MQVEENNTSATEKSAGLESEEEEDYTGEASEQESGIIHYKTDHKVKGKRP